MAILDTNEMFFTAFEPKQQNRFVMYMDGFPSYIVKGVSGISVSQETVELNHINLKRYVKGKTTWGTIDFTLHDPITPSGAQAVMEWVRLHHESVTGRNGYSDFYKKDLTFNVLGPVGDIVSEWIIKGALITSANFGEYSYDNESSAQSISMTVQPDYCVLNF
jgi:hypothetical protein